ncbi:Oidioi.mRNA.OKI2018_I69.XSR.g15163.t1.cds [Oikopleura dioica]|uniref:Oidioi.mRNA.OKI2018_I69.XSR.g15163.t1.cds n=1 Tax=Oikopleura dioica TaxID=34765 RepID=A0ABN7SH04_OIKDI|nr:Oidioi.mRNA.OKI2018_I69.XSR.g15163.t1.cds [Oikopleura dioica]
MKLILFHVLMATTEAFLKDHVQFTSTRSKAAFSRRRKSFNSAQSRRWTDSVIDPAAAFAHDVDVLVGSSSSNNDNFFDSDKSPSSLRSSVNFVSLADSQADGLPRPFVSRRYKYADAHSNEAIADSQVEDTSERLTRRKTSISSHPSSFTSSSSLLDSSRQMDLIPSCTQHHKKEYGCYTYLRNYSPQGVKQRYLSIVKCPKRRKSSTRRREVDCEKIPTSRSCRKSRRKTKKKNSRRKNRGRDSFKKAQCQAPGARYYVKGANHGPVERDHKNNMIFKQIINGTDTLEIFTFEHHGTQQRLTVDENSYSVVLRDELVSEEQKYLQQFYIRRTVVCGKQCKKANLVFFEWCPADGCARSKRKRKFLAMSAEGYLMIVNGSLRQMEKPKNKIKNEESTSVDSRNKQSMMVSWKWNNCTRESCPMFQKSEKVTRKSRRTQERSSVQYAGEATQAHQKKSRRKDSRRKDRTKDESSSIARQKYVVYFELNSLSSKMKHDELSPTLEDLKVAQQFHQRRRKN